MAGAATDVDPFVALPPARGRCYKPLDDSLIWPWTQKNSSRSAAWKRSGSRVIRLAFLSI